MNKWLSDEEIDTRSIVTQGNLPPFADITPIMEVFDQARETNRLREDFEQLKKGLRILARHLMDQAATDENLAAAPTIHKDRAVALSGSVKSNRQAAVYIHELLEG